MESSEDSYQDATGSQVPLRKRSSNRAIVPLLGPTPPSGPIRPRECHSRQPHRTSSSRTGSTSSIYSSGGPTAVSLKPNAHTLDDPILTITSAASMKEYTRMEKTDNGRSHVKKLEEDLKHCLSGPVPRRVVSDTAAARATRAGRMISEPGRDSRGHARKVKQAEQKVTSTRYKGKDASDKTRTQRIDNVSGTRSSAPDVHGMDFSADEAIVSGPRRAISLRSESQYQWSMSDGIGIRRVSWLGRRKLVEWGMGVYPRIVYASDSTSGSEDGLGGGLTGTVLCRMGPEHRVWDVVRRGQKFVVRVVGSYIRDVDDVVIYSVTGNGRSVIHSKRTGSGFVGVPDRAARICDESAGDVITLCAGVSAGGREVLAGEIRWRLGGGENIARSGAVLMRFGYYFFLKEATGVRLFTTTHTPEHVRLVARRAGDGSIDEPFSASLTYVVVRVAAD